MPNVGAKGAEAPAHRAQVLVAAPAHTALGPALTYACEGPLAPGTLVRVPFGRRTVLGLVWDDKPQAGQADFDVRQVTEVLSGLPPLPPNWRQLVDFAAAYYQRSPGEVALAALPPALRDLDQRQLDRRLSRLQRSTPAPEQADAVAASRPAPTLSSDQDMALDQLARCGTGPAAILLHGVTGSGKTEVYLRRAAQMLDQDPLAQALIMVPEINLTPQLAGQFTQRFGADRVALLHSALTPAQRLQTWLRAHMGQTRVLLGTRLAIWAALPNLRLIIVDEEHDPSYKQQEGARYSSRDLAVMRGRLEGAQVILGSATPSLESWHLCRPAADGGRYLRITLPRRVDAAAAPVQLRLLAEAPSLRNAPALPPPLVEAIGQRLARSEQTLLLLNRRGWAPVVQCPSCNWKSACPHCSAYMVFHKPERRLRCHHCGLQLAVPRACPECGDPDIRAVGRGTQRLEDDVIRELAHLQRPGGDAPRVMRIDADTARTPAELARRMNLVHAGEADILIGTQMVAKGHDFRGITLVAALAGDAALFSADFRAAERWFALLLQAAGRAGRANLGEQASPSELWVVSQHGGHPVFAALRLMSQSPIEAYARYAEDALRERQQAGLPPFVSQALLRADARTQDDAQAWLRQALTEAPGEAAVRLFEPVPLPVARVADVERAQVLIESDSRKALQAFLARWQPALHELHARRATPTQGRVLRWAIDVDPQSI